MIRDYQKKFRDAVERLYGVFAKYPLRPDTEACPCCHGREDEPRLHSKPLRNLTAEDLEKYSWSAVLTWGNAEDFKHFLPRLFELLADPDSPGWIADTEVVLSKLHHAGWQDWSIEERAAVDNYLGALWQLSIYEQDDAIDPESVLCGIAQAVDDLSPYLEDWTNSGLAGHRRLASFIADQAESIAKKRELSSGFWSERTGEMNQVIVWLLSPETHDALELTFLEHSSDPTARDIATAVDTLEYLMALRAAKEER